MKREIKQGKGKQKRKKKKMGKKGKVCQEKGK